MRKSRFSKTPSETAEPFFFFLFPSGFSCFFFCERRNKRNETKNTSAKVTFYLATVVSLTTIEHRFFFDTTGAKKKLGKKKRRQGVSPLRRRGGLRALHPRELLKKLDQNFHTKSTNDKKHFSLTYTPTYDIFKKNALR